MISADNEPGPAPEPTAGNMPDLSQSKVEPPPEPARVDPIHAQYPTVGRIVHYVLPDGPCKGQVRAAIVTRVWSGHTCNVQVYLDGQGDTVAKRDSYMEHVTSVTYAPKEANTLRTWHWPPRA